LIWFFILRTILYFLFLKEIHKIILLIVTYWISFLIIGELPPNKLSGFLLRRRASLKDCSKRGTPFSTGLKSRSSYGICFRQYEFSRVEVSMYMQTAVRTYMPSCSKSLRHIYPTLTACNRSFVRRNFHNLATSFFRFVCEIPKESSPRSIINVLGEVGMSDHAFDIQIFNSNVTIFLNKKSGKFMKKIIPLICNEFVQFSDIESSFSSVSRAFDFPAQSSLQDFQTPFRCNEIARIFYLCSIRESSKVFKPDIDTNFIVGKFVFLRFNKNFTTENSKPFSCWRSLDSKRLDFALNGSMQNNLNIANLGNMEFTIYESVSVLRISYTLVTPEGFEAGESGPAFSRFYSSKKVLKCFVNSVGNILENLAMNTFEFRIFSFKFSNNFVHVKLTNGFFVILVFVNPCFKKFVIEKTSNRKIFFKSNNLSRIRIQTIFEHSLCRKHSDIYE